MHTQTASLIRFAVALALTSISGARAQEGLLLRGAAYSEPDAADKLRELSLTVRNAESWQLRAARIRAGIIQGAKLDNRPAPCPLNPIRHSKREMDGYSVENVAFESLPGYWVTGNLYLPSQPAQSMPGVLCPHGHGADARLSDYMQTRCAALARMGATVYAWDMVGFGESGPCPHDHLQTLRLQTYNSTRAVDFLLSLGNVDQRRLAVTGASGGGTQSFILSAIDDRIDVSVPVVQVSAHFFGGCVCESGMPIHKSADHETNNVEIAACFAPKPQLIVSDGADWTKNTPDVEFPYIQRVYKLLGAADLVENAHFADEGHDYGPSKRKAAYVFLAKHLGLDLDRIKDESGQINEQFVTLLPADQLKVFEGDDARPDHGLLNCDDVMAALDAN